MKFGLKEQTSNQSVLLYDQLYATFAFPNFVSVFAYFLNSAEQRNQKFEVFIAELTENQQIACISGT